MVVFYQLAIISLSAVSFVVAAIAKDTNNNNFASCFATTTTDCKSATYYSRRRRISTTTLLSISSDEEDRIQEREDRTNKLAAKKFAYMSKTFPRYQEEVVGISSALNLLRTRKRTRRIIYDKLNIIKKRRSKGRRKRLSDRFNQYFFRGDKSISKIFNSVDTDNSGSIDFNEYKLALQSTGLRSYSDESIQLSFEEMDADGNGEISKSEFQLAVQKMRNNSKKGQGDKSIDDKTAIEDDIIDDVEEDEEDEDDSATLKSLDAMRAKSGVLRTRIRLRQESLAALERLIRDVKLEMRRNGWPYKSSAAIVEDAFPSTAITYTETGEVVQDMGIKQDINKVMSESNLNIINEKWSKSTTYQVNVSMPSTKTDIGMNIDWGAEVSTNTPPTLNEYGEREEVDEEEQSGALITEELQLDLMQQRSLKLESSILIDRIRLQRLERRMLCYETNELNIIERGVGTTLESLNEFEFLSLSRNPISVVGRQAKKFVNTFTDSTSVLKRKLDRVQRKSGPNNRDYAGVADFVVREGAAGVRIVGNLLSDPSQLQQLIDPSTPTLVPHVPAILARLDKLESHVAPILSRVLNNKQHLPTVEPYLSEILERFDDIEPHLPWILDHIDILAPYTGLLLKHIDELLLYAEVDEYEEQGESGGDRYAFAEQLLPYLEVYVSQLDLVGPHLPLLRPHLPLMLKHNRIKILSPHVGKLFNKGYKDLSASANMDILLFYFGWALRIPFVPRLFFSFPGSPGLVSTLANKLPKRLVRGRCADITCFVDGEYGEGWNELKSKT